MVDGDNLFLIDYIKNCKFILHLRKEKQRGETIYGETQHDQKSCGVII